MNPRRNQHQTFYVLPLVEIWKGELWIIDRDSSSDLKYRWENPRAYGRGLEEDQVLFQQHNCHWIEPGLPGEGQVLIYNNGTYRPEGFYSSVEQVKLPLLIDGDESFGISDLSILLSAFGTPCLTP